MRFIPPSSRRSRREEALTARVLLRKVTDLMIKPFGESVSSRRDIVRIAQRFNAGSRQEGKRVPEGRQKTGFRSPASAVPPGLWGGSNHDPALKRWAIVECPSGTDLHPKSRKGLDPMALVGRARHSVRAAVARSGDGAHGVTRPTFPTDSRGLKIVLSRRIFFAVAVSLLAAMLFSPSSIFAQESKSAVRFEAVDIFVDSGAKPLAAFQLEFRVGNGDAKIVGVEGGSHAAFREPPFYDPKAIQQERVILAAFSTAKADQLPRNKTRVATIHLQINGTKEPEFTVKLKTAADADGRKIQAITSFERKEK